MNAIQEKLKCRQHNSNIEKNANDLPISLEGFNSKHSNLEHNNKSEAFNESSNGNGEIHSDGSNSCPQIRKIDPKKTATKPDYLLDIPSPDVIQKRLLQLSTAFSRTQLSTLFDFSILNNGRQNNVVGQRLFSTYFASSSTTTSSRLSIYFRNKF